MFQEPTMPLDTRSFDPSRGSAWPWRAGIVVHDPNLAAEIAAALAEVRATCVFQISASASVLEIFALVERDRPDLLFVELSATSIPAREWMAAVQADGLPLVAAVNISADPAQMISALRAGASEFLSLPMNPAIFDALGRIAARLDSSRPAEAVQGKIIGVVSAKGGCGATTLACHVGLALGQASASRKVLIADLDYQSPAVHRVCHLKPQRRAGETFESVRKLSSSNWSEFFTPLSPSVDVMAGPEAGTTPPEPWRIESLFRHLTRSYPIVLVDLGRHLNPVAWSFLQHVDELLVATAPDVLALYQTRYILQTLTSRGFERSRIRLILSMSENTPRDFWIESVEQMFEMRLFGVIPADRATMSGIPKDRLVFPADTPFGKAVAKLAARLTAADSAGPSRRAA
jgi:pilus assembly protein CpaE